MNDLNKLHYSDYFDECLMKIVLVYNPLLVYFTINQIGIHQYLGNNNNMRQLRCFALRFIHSHSDATGVFSQCIPGKLSC